MPRKKIQMPPIARLLPTAEAARLADCHPRTLHRRADEGRLTKFYVGTRLMWDRAELDALVTTAKPDIAVKSAQRLADRREKASA